MINVFKLFVFLYVLVNVLLAQNLNYNNLVNILNLKNEFDLNEFLNSKNFVLVNEMESDSASNIKVFVLGAVNANEGEEAVLCFYDFLGKLSKVEYVFSTLPKYNKFKSSYVDKSFVRKFTWVENKTNQAIYTNNSYTLHFLMSSNQLDLMSNVYRFGLIKRGGAFDRRDGFIQYYRKNVFVNPYENQDSSYFDGYQFKDFKENGYSREWITDDNRHYVEKYSLNKFGEYNMVHSISVNGDAPLVYKSANAEINKPTLNYLLFEKIPGGELKGVELGKGYYNGKNGEFIYYYRYSHDNNSYIKVTEKISLANYKDSPNDEDFRDFSVQGDEVSNSILKFGINAIPNGKYYYKDDNILIEGQYDYGLKSGIWVHKKGDKVIRTVNYKNGELIDN